MDIVIAVLVFFFLLGTAAWSYGQENKMARDATRLADIRQIQAAFELIYRDNKSYQSAACQKDDLVSLCQLAEHLPQIAQIGDPGKSHYLVNETPGETGYSISFSLEKSYGELSAGLHTLSEDGIK